MRETANLGVLKTSVEQIKKLQAVKAPDIAELTQIFSELKDKTENLEILKTAVEQIRKLQAIKAPDIKELTQIFSKWEGIYKRAKQLDDRLDSISVFKAQERESKRLKEQTEKQIEEKTEGICPLCQSPM